MMLIQMVFYPVGLFSIPSYHKVLMKKRNEMFSKLMKQKLLDFVAEYIEKNSIILKWIKNDIGTLVNAFPKNSEFNLEFMIDYYIFRDKGVLSFLRTLKIEESKRKHLQQHEKMYFALINVFKHYGLVETLENMKRRNYDKLEIRIPDVIDHVMKQYYQRI